MENFVCLSPISSPAKVIKLRNCDSFFSKLLGLMFKKELNPEQGIFLANKNETRIDTAIHMLFMRFDIAVLWLNKDLVIVDKVLAKKWVPIYFPKKAAQYVLELHHTKFTEYLVGEQLILIHQG